MNTTVKSKLRAKVFAGIILLCCTSLFVGCQHVPKPRIANANPSFQPNTVSANVLLVNQTSSPPATAAQVANTIQQPDWSQVADAIYKKLAEKEEREHSFFSKLLDKIGDKAMDKAIDTAYKKIFGDEEEKKMEALARCCDSVNKSVTALQSSVAALGQTVSNQAKGWDNQLGNLEHLTSIVTSNTAIISQQLTGIKSDLADHNLALGLGIPALIVTNVGFLLIFIFRRSSRQSRQTSTATEQTKEGESPAESV